MTRGKPVHSCAESKATEPLLARRFGAPHLPTFRWSISSTVQGRIARYCSHKRNMLPCFTLQFFRYRGFQNVERTKTPVFVSFSVKTLKIVVSHMRVSCSRSDTILLTYRIFEGSLHMVAGITYNSIHGFHLIGEGYVPFF
jgi:hypothetical protein